MNASEGLKRIAIAVRWIGLGLGLLVLGLSIWLASGGHDAAMTVVVIGVLGFAIFAGAGYVIGWIIEGFSASREGS